MFNTINGTALDSKAETIVQFLFDNGFLLMSALCEKPERLCDFKDLFISSVQKLIHKKQGPKVKTLTDKLIYFLCVCDFQYSSELLNWMFENCFEEPCSPTMFLYCAKNNHLDVLRRLLCFYSAESEADESEVDESEAKKKKKILTLLINCLDKLQSEDESSQFLPIFNAINSLEKPASKLHITEELYVEYLEQSSKLHLPSGREHDMALLEQARAILNSLPELDTLFSGILSRPDPLRLPYFAIVLNHSSVERIRKEFLKFMFQKSAFQVLFKVFQNFPNFYADSFSFSQI